MKNKYMKILIICLIIGFSFGCETKEEVNIKKPIIEKIESPSIDDIISKNNYILLDVRTIEEYNEYNIEGSINIPYDVINDNLDKLDISKDILVYCKSGSRASIAVNELLKNGYKAYNMGSINNIDIEKLK